VTARLSCALLVVVLAGCATTDRVILLPDDISGKVGKIDVVGRDGGEVLLDSAYGEARAGGGKVQGDTLDTESLRKEFGKELANLPQRPKSFLLYCVNGSDQLTPESRDQLPAILDEVAKRPAPEVVVGGIQRQAVAGAGAGSARPADPARLRSGAHRRGRARRAGTAGAHR